MTTFLRNSPVCIYVNGVVYGADVNVLRLGSEKRFGGRAVLGDELASATAMALVSFKTRGASEDDMSFAGRKDHAAAVAAAEEKVARNRRDFEAAAAEVAAVEEALAHAEAEAVERRRKAGSKSPQRRKPTVDWSAIGTSSKAAPATVVHVGAEKRTSNLFAERSFEDELRLAAVVPQGASSLQTAPEAPAGRSSDADAALLDGIVIPAAAGEMGAPSTSLSKSVEELMKESDAAFSQVSVATARRIFVRPDEWLNPSLRADGCEHKARPRKSVGRPCGVE
eukprot:COSAG02_NODE_18650_length_927_cov_0.948068_1_plen_281_part_00